MADVKERIKVAQKWITTSETDVFDDNVPESKFRYVLKVVLTGDQQSTRVAHILKKTETGSYTVLIPNISVPAPGYQEIPEGPLNPDAPIFPLEGGTNLAGKVDGNSISMTVWYFDDEVA